MNKLIVADALEGLKSLPSELADTCITSPPYYGLRDYGVAGQIGVEKTPAEYIDRLTDVFHEARRVLKDDGTLWVVIADSYGGSGKGIWKNASTNVHSQKETYVIPSDSPVAKMPKIFDGIKEKDLMGIPWMLAFALRADGWYLRSDIIWHKPNAMPESVKDRVAKSHEYIFMFSKQSHYYFDSEAILVPARYDGRKDTMNKGGNKYGEGTMAGHSHERWRFDSNGNAVRNRRDVWTVPTKAYRGTHFATFPSELIEPCILWGSRKGGTVLDPFVGSGTTALTANALGRDCVGIDLNPEYIAMAKERLMKGGE